MNSGGVEELWIVVGLGNPGPRYDRTRHNIGFMLLDELARELRVSSWRERDGAAVAEANLEGGPRLLLVKPLQFMNVSGEQVAPLAGFYKVAHAHIIVAHDDIDLPLGSLRIRKGGSDGGHRGIRSIIDRTGGADFVRLKLGVGRPKELSDGEVRDWVLRRFDVDEEKVVVDLAARGVKAVTSIVEEGIRIAQNKFNYRPVEVSGEEKE